VTSQLASRFRTASAASIPATPFPMMTIRIPAHDTMPWAPSYSLLKFTPGAPKLWFYWI
jgi:hypothetical protein